MDAENNVTSYVAAPETRPRYSTRAYFMQQTTKPIISDDLDINIGQIQKRRNELAWFKLRRAGRR